jgi:hypothetical protein
LILDDLTFRNPIRLCGRGGISSSLGCGVFVKRDLTRASYVKPLPWFDPLSSRGIVIRGNISHVVGLILAVFGRGGSKRRCCTDQRQFYCRKEHSRN